MLKSIQKYFKNRTEAAEKVAFEDGFGWAMTEVFLNGKETTWVGIGLANSPFDKGAVEALRRADVIDDERREYNELKPHYAALDEQNTSLRNEVNWYTEQLTASNNRIHELNAANKGLRVTLTNLLAEIPDAWEPGGQTARTSQLPKDLEGIALNSEWPELWVAQDENGAWNQYNGDIEPSEEVFGVHQWTYHASTSTYEFITQTNKNPNWKETKQRIR